MKGKLGTLGDNNGFLTCSMYIAQKWHKYEEIIPYMTFEAAAIDLKENKLCSILVPAAYPQISEFIMDKELITEEVFIEQIPSLVCVGKYANVNVKIVDKIYLHQATYKLLGDLGIEPQKVELCYVNSNIEACQCLLRDDSKNILAITNKLCAEYFSLNVINVLRNGVFMPWISFGKTGKDLNG
jgi:hypothetical protein|nr:hypothetical protein [uncultured Acetatifactor sp.]